MNSFELGLNQGISCQLFVTCIVKPAQYGLAVWVHTFCSCPSFSIFFPFTQLCSFCFSCLCCILIVTADSYHCNAGFVNPFAKESLSKMELQPRPKFTMHLCTREVKSQHRLREERHVRFITKKLVDNLLSNGQALGKAWKSKPSMLKLPFGAARPSAKLIPNDAMQ